MRIVVLSDFHSGHIQGLTTPNYFVKNPKNKDSDLIQKKKIKISSIIERQVWKKYTEIIDSLGHIDICFALGDLIDGRSERSGGSELITSDLLQQCDIAIEALKRVNADNYFMVYGTPYHTGKRTDYERIIANELNADIDDFLNVKVKKVTFDLKHKMSSSITYTGKGTGILREINAALFWEMAGIGNKIDVCIRAHVHYPFEIFDPILDKYGFILPALQWSTKYGARQCIGLIYMGLLHIDINNHSGKIEGWKFHLITFKEQKSQLILA